MTPEQIRGMYAEIIARGRFERWGYAERCGYADELWADMAPELMRKAYLDVDALAAKGLLPVQFQQMPGGGRYRYVTMWQDPS